ncbi:MAG TPA: RluA family pseudouridine synthase [Candidatus Omnitrophota bacterium]|nr:RluA family pseudouridine synthase [Candidatus Omnitrophota bacterium]
MINTETTKHPVVFEDDHLLIINKPHGVLSHPNPNHKTSSAAFEGNYDFDDRRFDTPRGPVWLIHRLDQDTSGVLLGVKNKKSAQICRETFEQRKVEKDYLALVSRKPMPPQGKWKDSLKERRTGSSVRAMISRSGPPNAFLAYRLKEFFPKLNLTLLEIKLVTGKTHQIRVQSACHGHFVAGDRVYGNFGLNKELRQAIGLNRLFLHAWRLVIRHPVTSQILEAEAPLPDELEKCLLAASFKK